MINPSSKVAGVSILELKKTEKELGALFPDEYKELFLETNGAKFGDWTLFPIPTNQQLELTMDIIKQNRELRPNNVPIEMICIGENDNGDKLCYRIRKRFMQELVYTWNDITGLGKYASSTLSEFIDWRVPKLNTNRPKAVGTFKVESGKLIVTDPCYQVDEAEEMQITLSNVKGGKWRAYISYTPEEDVESLFVYYGEKKPSGKWHACEKMIGVDSAQAGIFDLKTFGRDDAIQFEGLGRGTMKMFIVPRRIQKADSLLFVTFMRIYYSEIN